MQDSKNERKQGGLSWSTPAQSQVPTPPANKQFTAPKPPPITIVAPSQSSAKKYAVMIALGILAGVIIAWGWSAFNAPSKNTKSTSSSAGSALGVDASSTPALASGLNLTITSPQAAGNSVAVAKAVVSVPTWIVVYEDNNGKAGNALGAALFFPESQSGTVELLRGTTPGKSYLVAEQVDNGDRRFSLKDDQFVTIDGAPQWVTFEAK